jgi:hypothetical protein
VRHFSKTILKNQIQEHKAMAKINFGGTVEEVVTREEFPLEKAREVLKNEVVAVLGYGVQGPAQAMNMRDNGINVIVGQREGTSNWDKAVADGWVPGETLFPLEEAAERGTVIQYLLSDAGQRSLWPKIVECLNEAICCTSRTAFLSPTKTRPASSHRRRWMWPWLRPKALGAACASTF